MAIKENATVKVIAGVHEGKTGKVVKIHEYADIAVVSFDDNGGMGKVSLSQVVEIQTQETRIVDVKIEIPESAKKITRAEVKEAIRRLSAPDNVFSTMKMDPQAAFIKGLTCMLIGDSAIETIFEGQDVVVMTEDDFVSALWNACDPLRISETVKKGISPRKCIHIAITTMIGLEEIVGILFGAEND